MSQLSNCLKMVTLLRARGVMNASQLSEVLEVKERMIRKYKQDIEMAGIPIATKPGRYGGYYLEQDQGLPEVNFQKEELLALRTAYEMINSNDSFPHKIDFEMAYNRVQSLAKYKEDVDKTMYYIKRSRPNTKLTNEKENFLKIHGAILTNKKLKIMYSTSKGEASQRVIRPYVVVHYNDAWYVRAYCEKRKEERTFKIIRMNEVDVLEETFEKVAFQMEENKLGICDDAYDVELIISSPFSITVPESIWGENQRIEQLEDEKISFQATMHGKASIVKWILGMGSCVRVIGPVEIKEKIVEEVRKMNEIVKDGGE